MPFDSIGDCQHNLTAEFRHLTLRISTSQWSVLHIVVFEFGDTTGFTVPTIHLKHKLYSSKAGLLYCIVLLLNFEARSRDRNLTYGAQ